MSESGAVSARDQLARLEEALADNASLRRHASSVAHDFNNLLAVITGYTEMMLKRLRADDPLRRNAEAIKRATEWGAALAQQILSGSRRTLPAPVPVDLNQLVGNVTRVLQPLLGDSIELVTRLSPSLARVSANPHRIGQVIMNLVVNARDAMTNGGRLTIETSNVGQAVMLAVGDTGCGMDDETRARLFEPYFTTKEPGRGSGLGLATVYDVVTQSGGQISVTSDTGAGSTFKIYLPRVPEGGLQVETVAPPAAAAAGGGGGPTQLGGGRARGRARARGARSDPGDPPAPELRGSRGGRPRRGAGPQRAARRPHRLDGRGRGDPALVRRRVGGAGPGLATGNQGPLRLGLFERQRVGRRAQARPAPAKALHRGILHEGDRSGAGPVEVTLAARRLALERSAARRPVSGTAA
jgi:two-component sensor histidine kinase